MMSFIAKLYIKEGREEEFEELQIKLAKLTYEQEPDTLVYDLLKHRDEPRCYVVYSSFKDEAVFETHQASSFHDDLVPPIMDCLEGEMELQLFDGVG